MDFWDDHGRVTLGEFLRCCGQVAAGVWDQRDLAVELVENDATVHLEPDEFLSRAAVELYEAGFRAYRLNADEDEHGTERAMEWAVAAWEAIIERVAERLVLAAEAAQVSVVAVEPVGATRDLEFPKPPWGVV